jgi:hypothetical protein
MKNILLILLVFIANQSLANDDLKANFKKGNPVIKSINALSFGPNGILFIGDSESAAIYALDTEDVTPTEAKKDINISNFDQKVAAMLGTTVDQITIEDMAVNPISKNIYIAIQHNNEHFMLMKIVDGEITAVPLDNVSYSKATLNEAIAEDAQDKRGRSLRKWAISDIKYYNGQIMLTGLSNKEFSSTFRSMAFPFQDNQMMSSLEIYHAAHGQYETSSPVKTFTAATIDNKDYVIAAYTCTPLVIFPTTDLKQGEHVKGRTVAELGNWNTPLDLIVMEKEGRSYLLMANSTRALMKIALDDVKDFNGSLTSPIEDKGGTAGVDFIALPFVNVLQLDKLSDDTFLMLQRQANGDLLLHTSSNRWL